MIIAAAMKPEKLCQPRAAGQTRIAIKNPPCTGGLSLKFLKSI
jgi:hypothetical protein